MPTHDVAVAWESAARDPGGVDRIVRDASAMLGVVADGPCELSVVVVDDGPMADLNATWRGKDGPTDVLSFPQRTADEASPIAGMLGDIVLAWGVSERQAVDHGHAVQDEIRVLLAHGIAHLLGHDHHDEDETARMAAMETRLLAALDGPVPQAGLVARAAASIGPDGGVTRA